MKKVFGLLAMLAVAAGLSQTTQAKLVTRDLGPVRSDEYVYDYSGFNNPTDKPINMTCFIKLKPEEVQSVGGSQFISVKVGWDSRNVMKGAKVWLRNSYDGEDLATGTADLQFGWNNVKFTTPYTIPEDSGALLFGIDVVAQPGEYYFPTSTYGAKGADVCFLLNRDEYAEFGAEAIIDVEELRLQNPGNSYMVLALGTVQYDSDDFINRVSITDVEYSPMVVDGKPGTAIFEVNNVGSNDASTLTFNYKHGDTERDYTLTLSQPVQSGKTAKLSVPMFALGSGTHAVTLSKVNDKENHAVSSREVDLVKIPADVAASYERRALLEWYVSETRYSVPAEFTDYLWPSYEAYMDRMSLVIHHMSDQFMWGDDEDYKLAAALTDNGAVYCPQIMLNRTRLVSYPVKYPGSVATSTPTPYGAGLCFPEAIDTPTFAGLLAESSYDLDSHTATITVEGTIADGVLSADENLRLTVYVTEDNVFSNSQEYPSEGDALTNPGDFYHMAVIRQQPTSTYGDEITEHSGDFTRTYTVEIDPEWKPGDMKVVAVINRQLTNVLTNRNVINCYETAMDPDNVSISDVTVGDDTVFTVADGIVLANGSAEGVEVFTVSGMQVANSGLARGIYVVRAADKTGKISVK